MIERVLQKHLEPIARDRDGWTVRGDTSIYELNESLGVEIDDDEDFQTVAGLISCKLGKIPSAGDRVSAAGLVFTVREMDRNRIKTVRVTHEEKA